eukprot:symbB.v1.2.011124.t1/scaffold739.1/size166688/15
MVHDIALAHGTSLSSSRSFNLSRKLTQLAPFFEISTVFSASLKVELPQCGSNFTRSWLPCEVKSALG